MKSITKPPPKKLLTPQQVADWLDVKIETLANWRHNKRYNLPYVRIGRKIKYLEDAVAAFIEARTEHMEVN